LAILKKLYHYGMILRGVRLNGLTVPVLVVAGVLIAAGVASLSHVYAQGQSTPPAKPASAAGWTLPPDAETMKSPLTVDDKVLAAGKAIFKDKCQRCHGPGGLGDGPDADPDAEDNDLTNKARADRNPDGVVFNKVLNGRRRPKMPAFKEELTPEQIWTVVAYVQSLRKK
jgi:mono/diheme cytochrome c family protein